MLPNKKVQKQLSGGRLKTSKWKFIKNAIDDYIPVEIGPLSYDHHFVDFGEPNKDLAGDIGFIILKMGLKIPLLEVHSNEERKIFSHWNRIIQIHRFSTMKNCP